jgi:hypothetical protein
MDSREAEKGLPLEAPSTPGLAISLIVDLLILPS